jgi:hypothetical protein
MWARSPVGLLQLYLYARRLTARYINRGIYINPEKYTPDRAAGDMMPVRRRPSPARGTTTPSRRLRLLGDYAF